ncbi:phenylacetate--CoA ligase family protein [Proteobacteria bacterium 005FR1]|nr:phenylacetate--CoA ligase family protein [Proteobacteria bacterium 005FR1]
MNKYVSRYMCYYPATFLKGEKIFGALRRSRDFQWRSASDIAAFQLQKSKEIALFAVQNSAFYRDLYRGIEIEKFRSLSDFARLPTISKQDLIDSEADIRTGWRGPCETKTTGGSTGHPVRVLKNASALEMERAVTWRAYEWADVSVGDPQGRFWGIPHNRKGRLRAAVADFVANRKRISAFNLNEESLAKYYRDLQRFKPKYLYGYVSVIEALANFVHQEQLLPFPDLKSVITTSEVLYPNSREKIESVFGVKVFNEYGCGEVGSIAHECECGGMHLMADNLLVEVDGGTKGELLVTDFHNYKTPLIRYRVGDYASLSDRPCSCGRGLPILENVYGRAYDLIRLRNGTSIHPESLIYVIEDFKKDFDVISRFQAIQRSHEKVDIYVVPKGSWSPESAEHLERRMRINVSDELNYRIEVVPSLQREASGKMRLVKCAVPG